MRKGGEEFSLVISGGFLEVRPDRVIVLADAAERAIMEQGLYPAVDPLTSTSRILDPLVVGEEHHNVARGVQQVLQRYK
ncbi:unnamed protein product, partial [marine sediment metagenome]